MDPTPATAPTSPTPPNAPDPSAGHALVEYIRTNRQNAGMVLGALAVLLLGLTVFMALKGFRTPPTQKTPDKPLIENQLDLENPLPEKTAPKVQSNRDYHFGWIGSLLACLIAGCGGAWLIARPPMPTPDEERTEARTIILAVGGLLGYLLILWGLLFFYQWSESLVAWLDKGETREARWVMLPILVAVLGAGIVFVAIQPARAEERNNYNLRRLVYGSNFALTTLLLLVVLVIANVVSAIHVPNKLDVTESGFYSLTDETKALLKRLDPPVTAYAVLPDGTNRMIGDVRQFLESCRDASSGKFNVKFVSTITDKVEVNRLTGQYPQLDLVLSDRRQGQAGAVVLATGVDEKRHTVIPVPEFFAGNGFTGESRIFKELTLLADQAKPIVYFTQSNRELSILPGSEATDTEKADRLKTYLEKNYVEVRPLTFKLDNPVVPDDAAIVVIAGPRTPFSEPVVAALRKYMNTPRGAEGKKGKLVVLTGQYPGVGGKGTTKTGLDALLGELNVRLGDKFLYTPPSEDNRSPLTIPAVFVQSRGARRHPVATALKAASSLPLPLAREVTIAQGNPAVQTTALLGSASLTWLEEDLLRLPGRQFQNYLLDLARDDALRLSKDWQDGIRLLGVTVSEGPTARAAVYGCDIFVSDDAAKEYPPESAPYTFDLIGVTIDWLRDRPSVTTVEMKAKEYTEYKFPDPASVDTTRLLYLPLGLGVLLVLGLGTGVWMVRRK